MSTPPPATLPASPEPAPVAAPAVGAADAQRLEDWLHSHQRAMYRWAAGLAGTPHEGADAYARRTFAAAAVAVQRQHGSTRLSTWLFGECLLAAQRHAVNGALPEPLLAGLPPELRALLRLVARGSLSAEVAWGLLPLPMGQVRRRLVRARVPLVRMIGTPGDRH